MGVATIHLVDRRTRRTHTLSADATLLQANMG
jgi:hypothetical protein